MHERVKLVKFVKDYQENLETIPKIPFFKQILEIVQDRYLNNQVCNFIKKETLAQVFSSEFYEIFKNTFFYRTPLMAAS